MNNGTVNIIYFGGWIQVKRRLNAVIWRIQATSIWLNGFTSAFADRPRCSSYRNRVRSSEERIALILRGDDATPLLVSRNRGKRKWVKDKNRVIISRQVMTIKMILAVVGLDPQRNIWLLSLDRRQRAHMTALLSSPFWEGGGSSLVLLSVHQIPQILAEVYCWGHGQARSLPQEVWIHAQAALWAC